jgi:hypothetical protein
MTCDVVIVGAGPGLAAAIRLKQRSPELQVIVVEKAETGAHILSGVVMDPVGLDALLPGWREEGRSPASPGGGGGPICVPDAGAGVFRAGNAVSGAPEQQGMFRRLAGRR